MNSHETTRARDVIRECLSDWENCPRTCPADNPADKLRRVTDVSL